MTEIPTPTVPTSTDTELAVLKTEIAKLQKENQSLKNQIAALRPAVPPDDFASAVQHSLDKLQTQLCSMTNPACNFAVKDFRIEANLWMAVNALGMVEYRFVVPGDKVDSASLTRISLELVPLAKPGAANAYTPDEFQPAMGIKSIEGLSANQLAGLHSKGIDTVADFVAAGARSRSSIQLVNAARGLPRDFRPDARGRAVAHAQRRRQRPRHSPGRGWGRYPGKTRCIHGRIAEANLRRAAGEDAPDRCRPIRSGRSREADPRRAKVRRPAEIRGRYRLGDCSADRIRSHSRASLE